MIFTTINLFPRFQRDKTDYVLSRDNEFRGGVETSAESIAQKKRFFLHWAQTWRVHSHTLSNVYLLLSVAERIYLRERLFHSGGGYHASLASDFYRTRSEAASAAASARSESNLLLLKFPLFSAEKFALFIHQPLDSHTQIQSRRADIFSHIVD